MRDKPVFADYLRDAMRDAGIDPDQRGSVAELARKADLSETQVSRWLNSAKAPVPSVENLRKIARVLRVRMLDLLVAANYLSHDEVETGAGDAERGIRTDPGLGDRERRLLLALLQEVRNTDASEDDRAPRAAPSPSPSNGAVDTTEPHPAC